MLIHMPFLSRIVCLMLLCILAWPAMAQELDKDRVAQLVQQLGDDDAADRDAAEKELLEIANAEDGANRRQVLDQLPNVDPRMPADLQHRLGRVRESLASALAEAVVAATRLTLDAKNMSLSDVLAAIERQTGNRFLGSGPDGVDAKKQTISLRIDGQPFWRALDAVLDKTSLDMQGYSGKNAIALARRQSDRAPRAAGAYYSGPFRFEATDVYAQRNLRYLSRQSLRVSLEIAWEPRLQPIRLTLPMSSIAATDGNGKQIAVLNEASELNAPVHSGGQTTEMQIPFRLPDRSVQRIMSLRGQMIALVPGRVETFRFDNLADAKETEQRRGGVVVTLGRVRKNNDIWEVHMRLRFDKASGSFASHLGWMLQNETYMEADDGKPIEHLGYETTRQTKEEIGLAYLFELPEGKKTLDDIQWVYKTPAAIVELPIEFELKEITLP